MYGMSDAIREYQEEVREKNNYIKSLEFACAHILDWYWKIDEPGLVPNSSELRSNLRYIHRVLKTYRGEIERIKEKVDGKGR